MTVSDKTEQMERCSPDRIGCRLSVVDGEDAGSAVDLKEGSIVLGSAPSCGLRLSDSTVSGQHLRVEVVPDGIKVTDLDSTNGTYYLGTRIRDAVVSHGAVLMLGRTRINVGSLQPVIGNLYSARTDYGDIVGSSPAMRRLFAVLERLEGVEYTVVVQGETGAGKELVAREVYRHSPRARGAFEILDCGAVPAHLAESELFGHVRGAFTGAVSNHDGVFTRAHGGTVFLDEIGELPMDLQPKLLRVLETQRIRPVGGSQMSDVNVRVIGATNRSLGQAVKEGRFREDLYFRLNVVTVEVPPLRDRREDIPVLVLHFLESMGGTEVELSSDTLELFTCGYDWPGNVRELRNAIARVLSLGTLPDALDPQRHGNRAVADVPVDLDEPFHKAKKRLVDAFERDYLSSQLRRSGFNLAKAARLSGTDRSYFRRLLQRHSLLGSKKSK